MRLLTLLLLSIPLLAQDAPSLFYSKSFPGSRPAYQEIRLSRDGTMEYREGPEEDDPVVLKLSQAQVDAVFALSDKLNHLDRQLESGLKVARMGEKTMRWQQGAVKHEVKYNYTTELDGQALQEWFENLCDSARLYIDLERTVKYDKLGVNQALLRVESGWDRQVLVGTSQFLPMLDRIVKNETFLNMARDRAEKLAAQIRSGPPKPNGDHKSQ